MTTTSGCNPTEEALTGLLASARRTINTYNGAGEPWYYLTKIVNGHRVRANIMGWDGREYFEVDGSAEPLSMGETLGLVI